jgi:hypothetical protein
MAFISVSTMGDQIILAYSNFGRIRDLTIFEIVGGLGVGREC